MMTAKARHDRLQHREISDTADRRGGAKVQKRFRRKEDELHRARVRFDAERRPRVQAEKTASVLAWRGRRRGITIRPLGGGT